jgi:hypothetical protein
MGVRRFRFDVSEDDAILRVRPSDLAALRLVPIDLDLMGSRLRRTGDDASIVVVLP